MDGIGIVLCGGAHDGLPMTIDRALFNSGHIVVPYPGAVDTRFDPGNHDIQPVTLARRIYRRTGHVDTAGRHVFELT